MSSIKIHRKFPFARIGLNFELDPDRARANADEGYPEPPHWLVVFEGPVQRGDIALGPVYCLVHVFDSQEQAIAGVEPALFSRMNERLVGYHLRKAQKAGDYKLALRLVEGRGRADGYRDALEEMKKYLSSHPFRY